MEKDYKKKKNEFKEEKEEVVKYVKPKKKKERVLSFDIYFQLLLREKASIQRHHKAPMKKFAEIKGVVEATKEEFDTLFKNY